MVEEKVEISEEILNDAEQMEVQVDECECECSEIVEEETAELEKPLTVEQMASFLQVGVGTLKDWTKSKENPCPCLRNGTKFLRFEKEEVMNWLRQRTVEWYSEL